MHSLRQTPFHYRRFREHCSQRFSLLTCLGRFMTDDMHGERIRAIRGKLGLSQVQLAELLDVSNVTVNRWEKDRAHPHGGTIARLLHLEREGPAPALRVVKRQEGNLPSVLTSLVGRARDRERVREVLAEAPLVTIVGAAGAGKTTLALDVAQQMADGWPAGAWFVDLATVTEPDAVPTAVAFALGVRDAGQVPMIARLQEVMRERSLLILLDNCEHLRPAVAALVQALLVGHGASRILATSRIALGVPGERVHNLRPLPLEDAAELFLRRAQEQQPDLLPLDSASKEAVQTICLRLDGLPLAIELAAARTRVLSLPQIASRLDQRFTLLQAADGAVERQRTLRAAIAWSYDLLRADSARLFRTLGVFAGWSELTALEEVSGGSWGAGPRG